jgi:hypothetical protein
MTYRLRPKADRWSFRILGTIYGLILFGGLVEGEWLSVGALGGFILLLGYRWRRSRVVPSDDEVGVHAHGHAFPNTGIAVLSGGGEVAMRVVAELNSELDRRTAREAPAALV